MTDADKSDLTARAPIDTPASGRAAADQLHELAAIAGGLAHEIRNALSTLSVNLQLLDEDWRDLDAAESESPIDVRDAVRRGRQRVSRLLAESGRLETILNDFLEFVRHQELNARPIDLGDLTAEIAEFFQPQAHRHGIELTLNRSNESLPCRADPSLLKQAVLNVLINAQQAMENGGRIEMTIERGDPSQARLTIVDTGSGIATDALSRIFEAYYTTKRGGTGLGLAMTRRIIRAHGGTVRADSTPGKGTIFTFQIPLAPRAEA